MSRVMTRRVWPWALIAIAGIALAALQIGDGLIVQRPEARMPLFLTGAVIATAGLLKLAAVATEPGSRRSSDDGSED